MKLEHGKKYYLRNGEGPHEATEAHERGILFPKCTFVINGCLYQPDGKFGNDDYTEDLDAVRESLTLEDGKYYEDASGRVWGPVREQSQGFFDLDYCTNHFWHEDGRVADGFDGNDLIKEVGGAERDKLEEIKYSIYQATAKLNVLLIKASEKGILAEIEPETYALDTDDECTVVAIDVTTEDEREIRELDRPLPEHPPKS